MRQRYTKYKHSGIDWLGEIPSSWGCYPLKYLLAGPMKYGANVSAESDNVAYPRYIRITDIGDNGELKEATFKSLSPEKAKDYLLKKGDILFARSGATAGKTFLFQEDISACFAGYLIKGVCGDKLLPKFLYYYTLSDNYNTWRNRSYIESTIPNISADKYSLLSVPVPTIEEQNKIVDYLNNTTQTIDAYVAERERELAELSKYKSRIISETVSDGLNKDTERQNTSTPWIRSVPRHWHKVFLKYIISLSKGKKPNSMSEKKTHPYMTMEYLRGKSNPIDYPQDTDDLVFVSEEGISLILWDGANAGEVVKSKIGYLASTMAKVEFDENIFHKDYLYYFLKTLEQTFKEYAGGTTIPHFDSSVLFDYDYYIPSLAEQKEISEYLDIKTAKIDSLIGELEKQIEEMKEYKTALISEVVTGKIKITTE